MYILFPTYVFAFRVDLPCATYHIFICHQNPQVILIPTPLRRLLILLSGVRWGLLAKSSLKSLDGLSLISSLGPVAIINHCLCSSDETSVGLVQRVQPSPLARDVTSAYLEPTFEDLQQRPTLITPLGRAANTSAKFAKFISPLIIYSSFYCINFGNIAKIPASALQPSATSSPAYERFVVTWMYLEGSPQLFLRRSFHSEYSVPVGPSLGTGSFR